MFKSIPCYYHPTTPVFIDDDPHFLAPLVSELKDRWVCKTFIQPQVALTWLQKMHQAKPRIHSYLNVLEDEPPEHRCTDLDIQAISEQLYNPERFTTTAVLTVDYTMPQLNGLALCKELVNTPYKKILLTGAADEKIAVSAFNQGLIQGYLHKDNPLLETELANMIKDLEYAYFVDRSKVVIENMAISSPIWGRSLFNSSTFADIFYPFYEQQKPVEYYLSALTGSFLLVNTQGQLSELTIVDEGIMKMFDDFIRFADISVTQKAAFSELQNRTALLAHHPKLIEEPLLEWLPYLYPAQKLMFQDRVYYYGYIEHVKATDLYPKTTISYQDHLRHQPQKENVGKPHTHTYGSI